MILDSKISPKLEKKFALFIFDIYFMSTLFRRTQSVYYLVRGVLKSFNESCFSLLVTR